MNEETEIIENKKFQLTIAIIIGILFSFSFFSLYNYSINLNKDISKEININN